MSGQPDRPSYRAETAPLIALVFSSATASGPGVLRLERLAESLRRKGVSVFRADRYDGASAPDIVLASLDARSESGAEAALLDGKAAVLDPGSRLLGEEHDERFTAAGGLRFVCAPVAYRPVFLELRRIVETGSLGTLRSAELCRILPSGGAFIDPLTEIFTVLGRPQSVRYWTQSESTLVSISRIGNAAVESRIVGLREETVGILSGTVEEGVGFGTVAFDEGEVRFRFGGAARDRFVVTPRSGMEYDFPLTEDDGSSCLALDIVESLDRHDTSGILALELWRSLRRTIDDIAARGEGGAGEV